MEVDEVEPVVPTRPVAPQRPTRPCPGSIATILQPILTEHQQNVTEARAATIGVEETMRSPVGDPYNVDVNMVETMVHDDAPQVVHEVPTPVDPYHQQEHFRYL